MKEAGEAEEEEELPLVAAAVAVAVAEAATNGSTHGDCSSTALKHVSRMVRSPPQHVDEAEVTERPAAARSASTQAQHGLS